MHNRRSEIYGIAEGPMTPALIIGDGSLADAEAAADAAMVKVADRLSTAQGVAAIREGHSARLMMVELSHDLSPDEELLLDLVAARPDLSVVIALPMAVLDRAIARLTTSFAMVLCAPDIMDRVAAISVAGLTTTGRVAEADMLSETARLQKFTIEVARIARTLAALVDDVSGGSANTGSSGLAGTPVADAGIAVEVTARDIRTMIRLRRQREALFGEGLFGDPVWDMLLDLAAARLEGAQVAVSSLCIAAMVPPTTALRWIAALTDAGVIVRLPDPDDRRRVFLALSEATATSILTFLAKAKGAGATLV